MRNLTRIAFVLALAACGNQNQINQDEFCQLNPTDPTCQDGGSCTLNTDCANLDSEDGCIQGSCVDSQCEAINVCEALGTADAFLFMNNNGSAFLGTEYDDSQGFDEFLDAEQAELAAIPVGNCAETDFPDIEGEPTRRSMGNVRLLRNGEVLADIAPTNPDDPRYEEILDAGLVNPGDTLDLEVTGSPQIVATTFLSLLALPPAFPVITGVDPVTQQFTLTSTLAFTPINADHVVFRFNFLEGQESVTITCVADGQSGELPLDNQTFARLPPSGSVSMAVFNRSFQLMNTTDGIARTIRGTAQATANAQYQK